MEAGSLVRGLQELGRQPGSSGSSNEVSSEDADKPSDSGVRVSEAEAGSRNEETETTVFSEKKTEDEAGEKGSVGVADFIVKNAAKEKKSPDPKKKSSL